MVRLGLLACLLTAGALVAKDRRPPLFVPETARIPVASTYHGVAVRDDYQWLEDGTNAEVRSWTGAQNRYTENYLSRSPVREKIHHRLTRLYSDTQNNYFDLQPRPAGLFALRSQPPKEQPYLVLLASADDPSSERVVLDPNILNDKGTTTIDFYVASNDGKYVAASLSEAGSEAGTVYVFNVETGRKLSDVVPRVQYPTAGGSLAWNIDDSGFYYTRYPRGNERPKEDYNFYQQIYFHKLGTDTAADTYSAGKEFPRIAEIVLESKENDPRYILASVANGDGGEYAHYVLGPNGTWTQVSQFSDKVKWAVFGRDNALYLLSRAGAPRGKILRVPLPSAKLSEATVVVPEGRKIITGLMPTEKRFFLVEMEGGPMSVRVLDRSGATIGELPLPEIASIGGAAATHGDEVLINTQTFIDPPAWFRFDPSSESLVATALAVQSPADYSDSEVRREYAVSSDNVRVPINIICKKGTKFTGKNPTLLYGYGGYGINLSPAFSARRRLWVEQGGVFAIANLRGGGEYGEAWHRAGNLTNKQKVFDDFAACAGYLIDSKYTNPSRLAIEGGSNGGLLIGAAVTQHPNLFQAAVARVGIFDMLRVELHPNGAFNVTEFGTVKDLDQFKALYAYSPYHHVVAGRPYPAVFLLTGENDGRVDPANSRKMTAALQRASSSAQPVLLRVGKAGHGMGTALTQRIDEDTDVYTFLFDQLNMSYR